MNVFYFASYRRRILVAAVVLLAAVAPALQKSKRPLTHTDYDSWRSISAQQLSPDGRFLAYALFPQAGDGDLVARNLATGKEWRAPIGAQPPPQPPDYANPDARPSPRTITLKFTADSRFAVFSTFPAKAELDEARKQKKKPEEMPKPGLTVLDLNNGAAFHTAGVKNSQVPDKGNGFIAYLHEEPKKDAGGELVLRNLGDGGERKFAAVHEYTLSKDAKTLVYADAGGVYAVNLPEDGVPQAVLAGKGKYAKLAWDEDQNRLAFLGRSEGTGYRLYLWPRSGAASELAAAGGSGMLISENGAVTLSRDGKHIFFGTAPPIAAKPAPDDADEQPRFDLWHWKDDYIQPMQKVRAQMERKRSYRAVFHTSESRLVQLADQTMPDVSPSEDGRWAWGRDDRSYRAALEYSERYADYYLVDTLNGSRKPVLKRRVGSVSWSPDARYGLYFDGKDWNSISTPDAKTTNLTAGLDVKFYDEELDRPETPSSYGLAGWTKDGKYAVLYDRFDIWRVAPDGTVRENLTAAMGRKQRLALRYVRLDPEEKALDPAKPMLLRAENIDTHDTGFFVANLNQTATPRRLLYGPKNYSAPIKARNADVLALTASTFSQFPDLLVTGGRMQELRKVSDANPQKSELLWGTAELVHFRNLDGVPLTGALYKPENFDPRQKVSDAGLHLRAAFAEPYTSLWTRVQATSSTFLTT